MNSDMKSVGLLVLVLVMAAVHAEPVPSSEAVRLRGGPMRARLGSGNTGPASRIVGGSVAPVGSRPYQGAVYVDEEFLCGAVLVDPEWVMTGAQCVYEGTNITVGLGIYNLTGTNDGRQMLDGRNFTRHANFSFGTMHNDIALIHLPSKAILGDAVQPIALPSSNEALAVGVNLTASGWGTLNDESAYVVPILHEVTVPSISNDDCIKTFGVNIIIDGTLCTSGQGGKGSCIGDSGGPLTYTATDGSVSLAGLLSFGHVGGCQQGDPDGNTRISYYLDWIQEIMKT